MPPQPSASETHPHRNRRRLLAGAVVVLVVLLLALTPPLINVNRLRRRIATSMSQSLGRPVHLDRVSLHLLPVPGFTLENLVVSEDPAFGYEPVIRANRVDATLRVSSLWRRQVEFATIRFGVDDFGSGPSINIVRNAQGHWNLEQILMRAAQVSTAPTDQPEHGPAPRFPYIEATGARVNVKVGDEKMPFSLTDADFALWLPSPEQWHVRLQGKPARTDTNASDTGLMRLEGTLERAARMADVPVDLHASWNDVPLGEASRLVTGNDAGWRGTGGSSATLTGPLGDAQLTTSLHLSDLRRADFIPAKSLDVLVACRSQADVTAAVLRNPQCTVDEDKIIAIADTISLTGPHATGLRVGMANTPVWYFLDWARLLSPDIPAAENPQGIVTGSITYAGFPDVTTPGWTGQAQGKIHGALPWDTATGAGSQSPSVDEHSFGLIFTPGQVMLTPVSLGATGKPLLTLTGSATSTGYSLALLGSATEEQVRQLAALLPPLGAGVEAVLPVQPGEGVATPASPLKLNILCMRTWADGQTCHVPPAEAAVAPKPRKRR